MQNRRFLGCHTIWAPERGKQFIIPQKQQYWIFSKKAKDKVNTQVTKSFRKLRKTGNLSL